MGITSAFFFFFSIENCSILNVINFIVSFAEWARTMREMSSTAMTTIAWPWENGGNYNWNRLLSCDYHCSSSFSNFFSSISCLSPPWKLNQIVFSEMILRVFFNQCNVFIKYDSFSNITFFRFLKSSPIHERFQSHDD